MPEYVNSATGESKVTVPGSFNDKRTAADPEWAAPSKPAKAAPSKPAKTSEGDV